jgi:hypothetical protein
VTAAIVAEIIDLAPPEPERQIAPPSEAPETDEPDRDAKLGERNTKTDREALKRGEDAPKGRPKERDEAAAGRVHGRTSPPPPAREPVLRLGESDLLAKLGPGTLEPPGPPSTERRPRTAEEPEPPSDREREVRFLAVEPFRRGSGFGSLAAGSSDLLTNVPDGDITLLNEKADRYAVFVRRVALQVFGALRRSSWTTIPPHEVSAVSRFVRVRAVLSPQGKLLRSELLDGSGSFLFDDLLKDAVEHGASDQNPPREAATTDGNFHFLFLARMWSRRSANNVSEQRWIVLGTGLE